MDWLRRRLCLLFTPEQCRDDPWRTLEAALSAGLPLVQWRVKHIDEAGLRRCMTACAAHDVPVIVNDHVVLAVELGAAGAHVGQDDTPARTARRVLEPSQVLGVSTHAVDQARRAQADGADYLGIGPCHATATKGYDTGLPTGVLTDVLATVDVPVFAIGGITPDNLPRLRELGFGHFAVSSAVLAADRPGDVVSRMLASIA